SFCSDHSCARRSIAARRRPGCLNVLARFPHTACEAHDGLVHPTHLEIQQAIHGAFFSNQIERDIPGSVTDCHTTETRPVRVSATGFRRTSKTRDYRMLCKSLRIACPGSRGCRPQRERTPSNSELCLKL